MSANQLSKQLQDALEDCRGQISEDFVKVLIESANDVVSELKRTSPKGNSKSKHYANGWTYELAKAWSGITLTIYNKNKPSLTHLLNDGHLARNGKRVEGDGHIDRASEYAIRKVEEKL